MVLTKQDEAKLRKLHSALVRVVMRAAQITKCDFKVLQTIRTLEEQKRNVASGASKTLRSRHLPSADGLARAVDLAAMVDGKVRWDWPLYHKIAAAMKQAAKELRIPLEWGGDWKSFKDGPHFQLPWKDYP